MNCENEYLSDAKWDALQAALANALLPACDAAYPDAQDRARDRAAVLLADMGVCFEGMRADFPEPDHATIKFAGLTAVEPISLNANRPLDQIEAIVHIAMRNAAETFMRTYRAGRPGAA